MTKQRTSTAALALAFALAGAACGGTPADARAPGTFKSVDLGATVALRGPSGERMRVRAYDLRITPTCGWLDTIPGACVSVRLTVRNTGRVPLRIVDDWPTWRSASGAWLGPNHRGNGLRVGTVPAGRLWRYDYTSRLPDAHLSVLKWFRFAPGGNRSFGPFPRDRSQWLLPVDAGVGLP